MIIRKKGYYLLVTAICISATSFPTHAWRAYGGGSGVAYGPHGGSASWSHGSGVAYGPHGGSAAWSHPHGYGYGYHPPAYYGGGGYSGGAVAAAGVAGLAVGAMIGAAAASRPPPPPTTIVVQQPMAPAPMMLGTSLTYLPAGCVNINISSGQYYQCGINWFRPYFGSNGAYYQVVPAPY
ncbi:hypothetical protein A1359_04165 [Methylomonas lenta]|uniref:RNA-binding protein n=1 Tax=Methylomonas lenta TaxID=980561 RepID=A0A177NP01_9GAMM|nr:hypothetical protein A1359_04165 [Methylomonas lenta]